MTRVICNHQNFAVGVELEQIKVFFILLSYLCFKTKKKQQKNSSVLEDERGGTVFVSVISCTVGEKS